MAEAKNQKPRIRIRKADDGKGTESSKKPAKRRRLGGVFGTITRLLKPLQPAFSFLGRILKHLIPRYFVNSFREVRKVTWPSRGETWRLTLDVFVFAAIFGTMVAIVPNIAAKTNTASVKRQVS